VSDARQPRATALTVGRVRRVWHLLERDDALLKHGIIVAGASLAATLLNYIYQFAMGRMLGPEQYGILGALTSLVYVLSVPAQSIQTSMARTISLIRGAGRTCDVGHVARVMAGRIALGALAGLVAVTAASGWIARFLQIPSRVLCLLLGPVLLLGLLGPALNGSLLGLQRFACLGITQVAGAAGKVMLGVALVGVGLGVEGAFSAFAGGLIVNLLLSGWFMREVLAQSPVSADVPRVAAYSMLALITYLGLALLYNIDVLLVRRFFTAAEAGYYIGAATLARAVYFGSIALSGAMFPKAALRSGSGDAEGTSRFLRGTLVYVGLLAGFGALVLNVFPDAILSLSLGAAYAGGQQLVGILSVAMLLLALTHVMISYGLAVGRKWIVAPLMLGVGVQAVGIVALHSSLQQVAAVVTVGLSVTFIGMSAAMIVQSRMCKKHEVLQ